MKHTTICMLAVLMSIASTKAFAYDIAVENADGKTIYYNYYNNGTELEVTNSDGSYSSYSGKIVIPETVTYMNRTRKVTSIGFAFYKCSNLTSVTIPNSVTSIKEWAFKDCTGLTSVTIGNSVSLIEWEAFDGCTGLKKVIISDIAAWCEITFDLSYHGTNEQLACWSNPLFYAHHLFSDENTEITNLVIPNSVTSINRNAFCGCSGLTSVTIPNSVTSIGNYAFYGCSGLTSVTIGNNVTTIGQYAFYNCRGLTSVTIPNSVTSLGSSAFRDCSGLTSVTIGNSVTSIGNSAFYGCSGLTSVTIGNSVKSIGYYAFYSCSGLTSVAIPNSVTSIGDYAFYGCSGLTSVTIPNSVTSIGGRAFYGCSGLTSVTIGSGVKEIKYDAFNCDNLATVISKIETPFAINGKSSSGPVFSTNTFMNADLFVPVGTIDKYKATQGWKDFVWITEGIPSGIGEVKTEVGKTEVSRYTLDGKKMSEPQEGINIIKMSDGTTKKVIVK